MNEQEKEIFERITAAEASVKSLHKRVDRHDALIESIQNMTVELKHMREDVTEVAKKVDEIESKPAKRWDSVVVAILGAVAGGLGTAIVTAVLGG